MIISLPLDRQYSIDNGLIPFLDKIAKRITVRTPKLDYAMLIDGYEGYGKTNISVGIGYYLSKRTGREFSLKNVFFDPEEMVRFAVENKYQIIIWDEAALGALAMDWHNKAQIAIAKMLYTARKNRHLFIFNIPRFYRMREPILERCMGLIHVYARKEIQLGRFLFYNKKGLFKLYDDYKRTKRTPNYKKYVRIRGSFVETLSKIFDEDEYDKKKDVSYQTILDMFKDKKVNKYKEELIKKEAIIAEWIKEKGLIDDYAAKFNIHPRTVYKQIEKGVIALPVP